MAAGRGLKIALAMGLVGLVLGGGLLALSRGGPTLAPDFAVTDLDGRAVRLSAFRGKVVLLNLWTTWCPPCREEMPSMERLHRRLAGDDFVLLAVSQDDEGKRVVEPFVKEMGISFPVLVDPEHQVGRRYGVWGYPETFVIDRNGMVVERVIGPRDWMAPAQVAALEALIAAGDATAGGASAPGAPAAPRGPHGPS